MYNIIILVTVSSELIHTVNGNSIKLMKAYNSPTDYIMNSAMVNIIENCFSDIKCIIFGGRHDRRIIEAMDNLNMFSSVRLIDLPPVKYLQYHHKKVDLMIINERDINNFIPPGTICQKLNLYTHEITVLVSCERSGKIYGKFVKNIAKLWQCSFLNVYGMCIDTKNKITIYTFHPYSRRDIYKWNKVNVTSKNLQNKINFGMTYYYRLYSEDDVCDGFNFDRTKHLDNLGAITAVVGRTLSNSDVGIKPYFEKALNTTIRHIQNHNKAILKEFYSNTFADFTLSSLTIHEHFTDNDRPFTFSHPLYFYSMFIVTHNRGALSPLEKIYNYYGFLIVLSTAIILTITFIVIYLSGHNVAFATFEILRLLINTGITVRMDTTKTRIFFSMIFLYFLIIHGTFSGRLAGFLTKFEYQRNVETLEELKDSRYRQIFVHTNAKSIITDIVIKNKTQLKNIFCTEVMRHKSVACIDDYYSLLRAIRLFDLHQSREPVFTGFNNYLVRKNWPLKSRFNNVLIWLVHSGISTIRLRRTADNDTRKIERRKALALVAYRPITFQDLEFSFVLLGAGSILALLAFFSEIFIGRSRKRRKNKQVSRVRIKRRMGIFIPAFRFRKQ